MEKQSKISFVSNATAREAFVYSILYTGVFYRGVWRGINKAAHKLPWLFILLTVAASFVVSFVFISKARAERDSYDKKLIHATQELNSYRAVYGDGKEVK